MYISILCIIKQCYYYPHLQMKRDRLYEVKGLTQGFRIGTPDEQKTSSLNIRS